MPRKSRNPHDNKKKRAMERKEPRRGGNEPVRVGKRRQRQGKHGTGRSY